MSIPHPGKSSDPGITQTHGLLDDKYVSPEYSTAPEPPQSQSELGSEDDEEEATPQESKVSNAKPFSHMQSLVTTHQGVTLFLLLPNHAGPLTAC